MENANQGPDAPWALVGGTVAAAKRGLPEWRHSLESRGWRRMDAGDWIPAMFDNYEVDGLFDEVFASEGRPRKHYSPLVSRLKGLGHRDV